VAITIELPDVRRLAFEVVLRQAGVTVAAVFTCWMIGSANDAVSALLGGAIGTVATLAMAFIAFGGQARRSAPQVVAFFFAGELAKLVLMVSLFIAAWHWMRPAPIPMLAAYGATFLAYWVALAARGRGGMQPLAKREIG